MFKKHLHCRQNYRITKKFCKKYDLDQKQFKDPLFHSGPDLGRDNYVLYSNMISLGFMFSPVDVSSLKVLEGGRFSNSLQQLCHALLIAQHLGVTNILIANSFWYLPNKFVIDNILFTKYNDNALIPEGICLEGHFHKLKTLLPVVKGKIPARHKLAEKFIKHFTFDQSFSYYELAIHIRSGDIFVPGRTHPYYGQPPLSYYLKILNGFDFSRIAIVYEDLNNPVIPEVIKYAKKKCKKVDLYINGLEEAIKVLLNSRSIVAGLGTFISGIVAISNKVENVFIFNNKFNDWGKNVNLINIKDIANEYHNKVTNKNWRNTPEQLSLMMTFPEEKLEIEGMLKSEPRANLL